MIDIRDKPRIRFFGESSIYCYGHGAWAWGSTIEQAYTRWAMKVELGKY